MHFSRLAAVLIVTSSMLFAANHSTAQSATAQRTTWEQDYDNGRAAYQKRKHDEAERLWKSALAKKAPPRLVNPKLAVLYTDLGRFWEAMVAYDEYFKAVGNPPPVATQVGSVATDYARCLIRIRRFADAEKWVKLALDIHEKVTGKNTPEYAYTQLALARVLSEAGRYDEAQKAAQLSYKIYSSKGAAHSGETLILLVARGDIYRKQGKYDEASAMLNKAVELDTSKKKNTVFSAIIHASLGQLYMAKGWNDDARRELKTARGIMLLRLAGYYREIMSVDAEIAREWLEHKQYADAEESARHVLKMADAEKYTTNEGYAQALVVLARCHIARGQMNAAEPLLNQALTTMIKLFPHDYAGTQETLTAYADFLRANGRAGQVANIYAQAKDLRAKIEKRQQEKQQTVDVR